MTLHLKLQQRPLTAWTDAHLAGAGTATAPFIIANSPATIRVLYTNVAGTAVEDATGITDILAEVWASPAMKTDGLLIAPAAVQVTTAEPTLADWNAATGSYYTAEIEMTAEETAAALGSAYFDGDASNISGWLEIRGTKNGENISLGSGPLTIYRASTGGTPPDGPDVYYTAAEVDAAIATAGGSGDVVGPSSAVNSRLAAFDGTTGKLIKDSTFTISGTSGSTLNIGTGGTLGTAAFTASTAYAAASHAHAWGSITGTLSDQTDLNTALGSKLNTGEVTTTGEGDKIPRLDINGSLILQYGSPLIGVAGAQNGAIVIYPSVSASGVTQIYATNATASRTWDHPDTDGIYASQNYVDTHPGSSNIISLGTITSGVWNGTTIAVANGGTGATDAATARTNLGLGNVDNTSNATERAATATLTNKRITPRIGTTTSSATPSINTDNVDQYNITALAAAITSMTTNLSGTPTDGQKLLIRIKDNGTARAITWGASFQSIAATLPTTTTANKLTYVGLIYNSAASKWDCLATGTEA